MGQSNMDKSISCGLLSWRPEWLQRFANRKFYLMLYSLTGILQGMTFSYLTVVLSTIEKRFGLKSKEAAWIYSGNEISQICFVVFLPFVGRVKKRPLFMAFATVLAAVGLFIIALPHFTGDQHYLTNAISESRRTEDALVCHPGEKRDEECRIDHSYKDWTSITVVFFGIFLIGIATSFFYSFGLPFVDDNSEKRDSPFNLSLVMAARTIGPALGFMLGSACLAIYVDPSNPPEGITEDSPRWVGAWWIGFICIGCSLLIFSPWLGLFPERFPLGSTDANKLAQEFEKENEPQSATEWINELKEVSKRLLSKPIFVYNLASSTFFVLGVVGYFTFIPKYFQFHFRQKASRVGAAGGLSQSLSSAVGILISGYLMKRFRFRARPLAAWCCSADIIYMLAFLVITLMKCPPLTMYGRQVQETGLIQVDKLSCNNHCDCTGVPYHPICARDGYTNFFSPCHAGCRLVNQTQVVGRKGKPSNKMFYWDCSCIAENFEENPHLTLAAPWWKEIVTDKQESSFQLPNQTHSSWFSAGIEDYCKVDCSTQFYTLIGFMFIAGLIGSSTRLPNMILSLRTIDKRDKAASFTLTLSVMSLFAILPSPLIVGAIMDETCVVWGKKCGETTNCLVYDIDKMRVYMAIFPAISIAIAFIFDICVWYHAKDLQIYDDDEKRTDIVKTCLNGSLNEKFNGTLNRTSNGHYEMTSLKHDD